MQGHNDLIAMRINGHTPASVSLVDKKIKTDWAAYGELPVISVDGDHIVDLDLRYVVNMVVFIESWDRERATQLFNKCVQAGALIVCGGYFEKHGDYKITSEQQYFHRDFGTNHA
jgi:hypothetical protein